jgi:glycosyltransferase involved in cell wall biosynthesis
VRVVHVIVDLDVGGAEITLERLLAGIDRARFDCEVISMTPGGAMRARMSRMGVEVDDLGMRHGVPDPLSVVRLTTRLRRRRPDVVHTWMYHANLLGSIAARGAGSPPVIWGIRNTVPEASRSKPLSRWSVRVGARLSRWGARRIVCPSTAAAAAHVAIGYEDKSMVVIPNGFDTRVLRPDRTARARVRGDLGIPPSAPVVGLVARFDPEKDHENFAAAAGLVLQRHPDVHFVLCGTGVTSDNHQLVSWLRAEGAERAAHLLGPREDVAQLFGACDVVTLASVSEAFPNVLGEAMACAVPCVTTDVGDAAEIVGDTGCVVPARDPKALADALSFVLDLPALDRTALGAAARSRIVHRFELASVVSRYESLYEEVAGVRNRRAA